MFRLFEGGLAIARCLCRLQRILDVQQGGEDGVAVVGKGDIGAAFLLLDAGANLASLENRGGDPGNQGAHGDIEQVPHRVAGGVQRAAQSQGGVEICLCHANADNLRLQVPL